MAELTYYACGDDEPGITMVCTECNVQYRARKGSHKDRRHCIPCQREFLVVQGRAINKVKRAVDAGLIKPASGQRCADCGAPAHYLDHRDYTKPLEVDPVCRSCNGRRGGAKWKAGQNFLPKAFKTRPFLTQTSDAPDCAAIALLVPA